MGELGQRNDFIKKYLILYIEKYHSIHGKDANFGHLQGKLDTFLSFVRIILDYWRIIDNGVDTTNPAYGKVEVKM